VKRFLAFIAAAALGVTMMLPATAFAEPEAFAPTASTPLTPQSLAAQPGDAAPVIRDGYTIEAPKPPPVASTGFTAEPIVGLLSNWPCSGSPNEGYGPRGEGFHYGVDIICGMGTPALATAPGVVLESEVGGSWGQYVKIDHGNGVATLCAHMIIGSQTVSVGQTVTAGEQIGLVGDSGNASVAHCHFEVWVNGNRVDPIPWLP
jgi:murein DD-endopeptidase MepM/ murein hydrolase activator NlpD